MKIILLKNLEFKMLNHFNKYKLTNTLGKNDMLMLTIIFYNKVFLRINTKLKK